EKNKKKKNNNKQNTNKKNTPAPPAEQKYITITPPPQKTVTRLPNGQWIETTTEAAPEVPATNPPPPGNPATTEKTAAASPQSSTTTAQTSDDALGQLDAKQRALRSFKDNVLPKGKVTPDADGKFGTFEGMSGTAANLRFRVKLDEAGEVSEIVIPDRDGEPQNAVARSSLIGRPGDA